MLRDISHLTIAKPAFCSVIPSYQISWPNKRLDSSLEGTVADLPTLRQGYQEKWAGFALDLDRVAARRIRSAQDRHGLAERTWRTDDRAVKPGRAVSTTCFYYSPGTSRKSTGLAPGQSGSSRVPMMFAVAPETARIREISKPADATLGVLRGNQSVREDSEVGRDHPCH